MLLGVLDNYFISDNAFSAAVGDVTFDPVTLSG